MSIFEKTWSDEYRVLNPVGAVAVPADYVGIHAHRWPTSFGGTDDPAPTYGYGSFRNWDGGRFAWNDMQLTSGGLINFSDCDTYLAPYLAAGKTITWCFGRTPTWAAQPANQARLDPYNDLGGSSPPASWAAWEAYVGAVATHYVGQIKRYEVWNEPEYTNRDGAFFWGTAAELVEMAHRARTVIKAIDPAAEVWSPSFTGGIRTNVGGFLAAQDPTSGKFGREVIDGIGIHPYQGIPVYALDAGSEPKLDILGQLMLEHGISSLPIAINEYGIDSSVTPLLNAWNALAPAERRTGLMRRLMIAAARGCKSFMVYSHGSTLVGDLRTDFTGSCAALTDIHQQLAGQTILAGAGKLYVDGSVVLPLANGKTVMA